MSLSATLSFSTEAADSHTEKQSLLTSTILAHRAKDLRAQTFYNGQRQLAQVRSRVAQTSAFRD